MAIRYQRRCQRDHVWVAWPFPDGTLHAGNVGYGPQGYGHSIENVGSKPIRILIGFNTGVYESIDLSAWIAGNSVDVLATNVNKSESLIRTFPRKDVFIAPGEWVENRP